MRIILPNTRCDVDVNYGPLFFLAGPVKGGDDWQTACVWRIRERLPSFYAVLPMRFDEGHSLIPFVVKGAENFVDQTAWERHFLEQAADVGCLIFWLPAESPSNPRGDGRPYAIDTRGELGEWRGRMMANRKLHVVIGAEESFPGVKAIKRNFDLALVRFRFHNSLKETVDAAIDELAQNSDRRAEDH